jgi:CubicO group peptidase (beta-lactamase class C family)
MEAFYPSWRTLQRMGGLSKVIGMVKSMKMLGWMGLAMVLAACAPAQTVDEKIKGISEKEKIPGASVLVVQKGKTVLEKGYGLANLEHKVAMKADTIHELASVSKAFTAVGTLLLVQDGKLSLDDKLSKFFPEGEKSGWDKITLRHLLQHTSGLPDYLESLQDIGKEWTTAEIVESISGKPLEFEPGTKFAYSNSGYAMLGFIIEKASGTDIGNFMRDRVWRPFGLNRTHLNNSLAVIEDLADGYERSGSQLVRQAFTSQAFSKTGDGHVVSTTGDLYRWYKALFAGKILKKPMLDEMVAMSKASYVKAEGQEQWYGMGIFHIEKDGKTLITHSGGWMGTTTIFLYWPQQDDFIAIFTNRGRTKIDDLLKVVRDAFPQK